MGEINFTEIKLPRFNVNLMGGFIIKNTETYTFSL